MTQAEPTPPGLLARERTALLVIDVQEAFRKAVRDFDDMAERCAILVRGAQVLGVPVIVTEQYPQGLGETVPTIARHLAEGTPRLAKVVFPACEAEGFELRGRDQALLCGIETHVCVSQTAHALLARDVEVHVAADAVASRREDDRRVGLAKMERAGAVLSSVETALLELCGRAGTEEFKQVQRLIT